MLIDSLFSLSILFMRVVSLSYATLVHLPILHVFHILRFLDCCLKYWFYTRLWSLRILKIIFLSLIQLYLFIYVFLHLNWCILVVYIITLIGQINYNTKVIGFAQNVTWLNFDFCYLLYDNHSYSVVLYFSCHMLFVNYL